MFSYKLICGFSLFIYESNIALFIAYKLFCFFRQYSVLKYSTDNLGIMGDSSNLSDYDEVLTSILVKENSVVGFLSTIFNFLARRTDFYYVPEGPYENMGFPAGVAEELVVKVLRSCDPKTWKGPNGAKRPTDVNNDILSSTVAQEVEVIADNEDDYEDGDSKTPLDDHTPPLNSSNETMATQPHSNTEAISKIFDVDEPQHIGPPMIPTQTNSETYNGAEREKYSWSQTIMELDVTVKLPPDAKSAKDLKVTINAGDICVACRNGDVIIKDSLPFKIKAIDSFWSISEGKLLMHLEKVQERWWTKLLDGEEAIDLSKIDCSRPLYELPDDHIAKVQEIQWNQERKMRGLPTTDELRNAEILRKAWNADGSPFKGKEFDPNMLRPQ